MAARDRAVLGARIVGGVIAIGIAAVVVGVATAVPLPTIGADATAERVRPVPTGEIRACSGALLTLAEGDDTATTARAAGGLTVTAHGALTDEALSDETSAGAVRYTSEPGVDPATVSAAQSQTPSSGGLGGFAAAACVAPQNDAWLVGGDTTVGRSGMLLLANPFEVPATVNLTIYGGDGVVNAPGATGITVPPLTQRAFSLAGFAPDESSLVVRVESRGGTIAASVQHTVERGIQAGGVDLSTAGAAPSTRQVIPGLVIRDAEATMQQLGRTGYQDLLPIVRLLAPGDTATSVTVGIVPVSATGTGATLAAELEPGMVVDLVADSLPDGEYTIVIESDEPVVAGARVGTAAAVAEGADAAAAPATDLMWAGSTPALSAPAQFSVPLGSGAGLGARLQLANPGSTPVRVSLTPAARPDAAATVVEVPAGGGATVPLAASAAYRIEGAGVHAAVVYSAPAAIAGFAVTSPRALEEPVRVFLR